MAVLRVLWACAAVALVAAGCSQTREVVGPEAQYGRPIEVITKSLGQDEVWFTFEGSRGIYAFDLAPLPATVTRAIFVLKGQRALESLTITPEGGRATPLHEPAKPDAAGVTVKRQGEDFVVAFEGEALGLLRRGGRIQVIDYWR